MRFIKSKKGTVVLYLSLVGFIIAVVSFFIFDLQQPDLRTLYVGAVSLDVIKAKQEYDKAVFYLDKASEYASEGIVYDFYSSVQDFGCGYSIDKQYVVVKKFGKSCITKQKVAEKFGTAFENSLNRYASNYPNKDVSFPNSYKAEVVGSSIIFKSEDEIIVNIGDLGSSENSVGGAEIRNYADYAEFLKKNNPGIAYVEYGYAGGLFDSPRNGRLHKGYDIAMPAGSKVYAAYDGEVIQLIPNWGPGDAVWVVDGDRKCVISYGHIVINPSMKYGRKIKAGDLVGTIYSYDKAHVDIKRWKFNPNDPNNYAPYAVQWEPKNSPCSGISSTATQSTISPSPTSSVTEQDEKDDILFVISDPVLKKKISSVKVDLKPILENFKKYKLDPIIEEKAKEHGVDPNLVRAIIAQESRGNPNAVSNAGAQGLMQLMPDTARSVGVTNSFDAEQNIDGGTRYIKQLLDKFGKIELALAAYNAGPGNVHDAIPTIGETQNYVPAVLKYYQEFGGSISSTGRNADTGAVKYSQKYSFKVPYKFDVLNEYEQMMEIADKSTENVFECLKKGSEQPDDSDVETCTKTVAGLAGGEDSDNVYYLKFEFPITFKPEKVSEKDEKIRFAYLLKDEIAPPKIADLTVKTIKTANDYSLEIEFTNLASDTAKYYLYCNNEGEMPVAEEVNTVITNKISQGTIKWSKNKCSGKALSSGKYIMKIIAEDEAGNKEENANEYSFEVP